MRAFRAVVSVLAASLLVPFLAPPPASASETWTPAERLGAGGSHVDMAVNAAGDAVAVWATRDHVLAAYRPAGRNWGSAEQVGPSGGFGSWAGSVVIDGDGDATTVWNDSHGVHVSDRSADGQWQVDKRSRLDDRHLAECGDAAQSWPRMAADEAGDIVFAWDTSGCEGYQWWDSFVWRFADGSWGKVRDGMRSSVQFTGDGVATFIGAGSTLTAATSVDGGPLGEWVTLAETGGQGTFDLPDMAVNEHGDLVVAAMHDLGPNGDAARVATVSKPHGQPWRVADETTVASQARVPRVALNDAGATALAYLVEDSGLKVMTRSGSVANNRWSEATAVSTAMVHASAPDIAVSQGGAAAVLWTEFREKMPFATQASYRPPGGTWGAPVTLAGRQTSDADGLTAWPEVVAYPNGMFTGIFFRNATMFSDHVHDDVPPSTHMRAPRRDSATSTRLKVAWTSTDEQARVRDQDVRVRSAGRSGGFSAWSTWKRGTTVSSAVYAAKAGRTYCFAARARDRVGNLGDWSTQRCVATPIDDRTLRAGNWWRRVADSSAFLDTLTTGERAGATLRLDRVRAHTLRLVARTCPGCGKVRVFHGGHNLGVFDLTSSRVRNRHTIVVATYGRVRGGTVAIRVVSNGKPVKIDGVVASR